MSSHSAPGTGNPSSRPAVRYEAQAAPSEGSRGAAEAKKTAWVGAFERVLGDHPDESAPAERSKVSKSANEVRSPNLEQRSGQNSQQRDSLSAGDWSGNGERGSIGMEGDGAPPSAPKPSPRRPTLPSQRSKPLPKSGVGAPEESKPQASNSRGFDLASATDFASGDYSDARQRAQQSQNSSSGLSHKASNRALRATATSPSPAPPKASTLIRSYAPEPEDEDTDKGQRTALTASLRLAKPIAGTPLVEVFSRHQSDKVIFENLYLNHAPGLQPVRLRNVLEPGKSVLIRLQSDLGHAVSFMRRKRTGPKNELDKLVWPSNTLAWAKGDGLSPAKLRELRTISTNLEVADSLILEGGASTEIFVIFRPNMISSTLPNPLAPLGSKVSAPSRSSSQSSTATSTHMVTAMTKQPSSGPAPDTHASPFSSSPGPPGDNLPSSEPSPIDRTLRRQDLLVPDNEPTEVKGQLSIRAWPLPALQQPLNSVPHSASNVGADEASATSSESSAASSRPPSNHGSLLSSSGGPSPSTAVTEVSDVEPQAFRLELSARFCRPQIALIIRQPGGSLVDLESGVQNIPTHRSGVVIVDFGDVIAGTTVATDLHVLNQSAIDCFWQGRVDCGDDPDVSPAVSLTQTDSSEAVKLVSACSDEVPYQPNILLPRTSAKLQLHLRPEQAGQDMEELIVFTNLHNTSNSIRLLIRANVLSAGRDTSLVVDSGETLDFGDCCGGQWARQLLVLRNTTNHSLDVALSAQKGHEVRFQQAGVAADTDYEHEGEEITVGATAASSDGSKSEASVSSSVPRSDSLTSAAPVSDTLGVEGSHRSLAMELIRTPTHNASTAPGIEPPSFDLSEGGSIDVEKTPMTLTPQARPPPTNLHDDNDDFDSSSVQSQAGSRPGSPVPQSEMSEMDIHSCGSLSLTSAPASSAGGPTKKKPGPKASVLAWREASKMSDAGSIGSSAGDEPAHENGTRSVSAGWSSTASSKWKRVNSSGAPEEDEVASFTSESTSFSQESRSVGAPTSSQAQSVTSVAKMHSRGSQFPSSSALRSVQQTEQKELEDLTMRPGEEVRIIVSYSPVRGELDETYSAGRLLEHTFRLNLDYAKARGGSAIAGGGSRLRGGKERRTVLCRNRTCTSFIGVWPKELDLGETNVGSRKSSQIIVTNYSELSARVDLRFVSKVLSMYRDEMTIPAHQSIHLSLDHSPRRVNAAYSKQITVANLLNRRNDQIFEVRSKNVDKQRISFHSLLYRILTPNGSNFLEFGDVNINSSRIRAFSIENVTNANLTLDISTAHPEDIGLYVKAMPDETANSNLSAPSAASEAVGGTKTVHAKGKGYEDHEPSGSVMARALPAMLAAAKEGKDGQPANKAAKGAELKERFLETISSDTPAHIRQENTSWRTAQKLSHYRKDVSSPSVALGELREGGQISGGGNGTGTGAQSKKGGQVNLVTVLKKGGKGRTTIPFGCGVAFKDRTLIQEFEPLDLATGPPLVAKRISTKSRCFQLLEQLETTKRSAKSAKAADDQTLSAPTAELGDDTAEATPSHTNSAVATPVAKRLPNALANDIKSKAGTPSRPVAGLHSDDTVRESQQRSPALTAKRKIKQTALDPTDVSNLSLDELLAALESQPNALSTLFFNSAQAEEKHVRTEINLQRELRRAIETRRLVPLSMLRVPPGEERQVVAVFSPNGSTRPHILGTARKQDSRIFLRLMDYDVEAVKASIEFSAMATLERDELPIRDLMVRTTVCRALLELGQPHINFGQMEKGETKTKKILIHNRSEWSARYCIRKSGSIASGDIKLSSGRYGVVSAHGKREVEFIFSPSLTGAYQEKLIIENVADRDRDLTVFLKATVRKKPNFAVEPAAIDFGECRPGKLTEAQSFSISNTTSKARTFVVAIDSSDLRHQRTIMDLVFSTSDEDQTRTTLTKAEETSIAEEVEHISQKLKIANRKGQEDKIKKYEGRLAELNVKTGGGAAPPTPLSAGSSRPASPPAQASQPSTDEQEAEGALSTEVTAKSTPAEDLSARATLVSPPASARLKRVSSTVTISLGPNASKRIFVRVRTSAVHTALTAQDEEHAASVQEKGGQDVSLDVLVHEVKNQDETRIVAVRARALWSSGSSGAAAGGVSESSTTNEEKAEEGPQEGDREEENVADPLPVHDSSAVIFTSDSQL
ncbi:hypothetical protein BCV69DRAFT_283005 [Microstroma glucosiphilum]|uniref:Uncharacterized protein n=1 Tax=Pseudomicrostroma glucosiphilum TaxID=1684307 RepID=A0A316U6A1_9BASI|nr:hypothetical protein BCV69DRAFT_283005 [Pseudomicrostroma glucosiphilum]PWN20787.1 hypothetical protein BCV69DRAFT_283005 [Pseudomicrostroma glucosiphilum]